MNTRNVVRSERLIKPKRVVRAISRVRWIPQQSCCGLGCAGVGEPVTRVDDPTVLGALIVGPLSSRQSQKTPILRPVPSPAFRLSEAGKAMSADQGVEKCHLYYLQVGYIAGVWESNPCSPCSLCHPTMFNGSPSPILSYKEPSATLHYALSCGGTAARARQDLKEKVDRQSTQGLPAEE